MKQVKSFWPAPLSVPGKYISSTFGTSAAQSHLTADSNYSQRKRRKECDQQGSKGNTELAKTTEEYPAEQGNIPDILESRTTHATCMLCKAGEGCNWKKVSELGIGSRGAGMENIGHMSSECSQTVGSMWPAQQLPSPVLKRLFSLLPV